MQIYGLKSKPSAERTLELIWSINQQLVEEGNSFSDFQCVGKGGKTGSKVCKIVGSREFWTEGMMNIVL